MGFTPLPRLRPTRCFGPVLRMSIELAQLSSGSERLEPAVAPPRVDRWVTWLDTRKVGPRLRAEILIATARAYQALGRLTAARSALQEAAQVTRWVPGRELALAVRRAREQLTAPEAPFERGVSRGAGSAGLTGITTDAIRELTRAPVGALADWE